MPRPLPAVFLLLLAVALGRDGWWLTPAAAFNFVCPPAFSFFHHTPGPPLCCPNDQPFDTTVSECSRAVCPDPTRQLVCPTVSGACCAKELRCLQDSTRPIGAYCSAPLGWVGNYQSEATAAVTQLDPPMVPVDLDLQCTGRTLCRSDQACQATYFGPTCVCPVNFVDVDGACVFQCPPGQRCIGAAPLDSPNSYDGIFCSPGTYCPGSTVIPTQPEVCPAGAFCDWGSSQPLPCPQEYHCPEAGLLQPILCNEPGRWCPIEGLVDQLSCPIGGYCQSPPYWASTSAVACPLGMLCDTAGLASPKVCPVGSYCPSAPVRTTCDQIGWRLVPDRPTKCCPADTSYLASDDLCLSRFTCPNSGVLFGLWQASAPPTRFYCCPQGFTIEFETPPRCSQRADATGGPYQPAVEVSPTRVPAGRLVDEIALGCAAVPPTTPPSVAPGKCLPGAIVAPCSAGYYCPAHDATADAALPVVCPTSFYCPGLNASAPTECPPGHTCVGAGLSRAEECPAGYDCSSGSAVACPDGYSTSAGSTTGCRKVCTKFWKQVDPHGVCVMSHSGIAVIVCLTVGLPLLLGLTWVFVRKRRRRRLARKPNQVDRREVLTIQQQQQQQQQQARAPAVIAISYPGGAARPLRPSSSVQPAGEVELVHRSAAGYFPPPTVGYAGERSPGAASGDPTGSTTTTTSGATYLTTSPVAMYPPGGIAIASPSLVPPECSPSASDQGQDAFGRPVDQPHPPPVYSSQYVYSVEGSASPSHPAGSLPAPNFCGHCGAARPIDPSNLMNRFCPGCGFAL